ncbi:MAG: hypothetical protein HYT83_03575 [Candidatus Levybacteria bacterium]|nr:hypothetical protein [Candidatus Levybacteria bacterium]
MNKKRNGFIGLTGFVSRRRGNSSSFLSRVLRFFNLNKRQRFIISVILLSLGLFFAENLLGKSGIFLSFFLSILTAVLLLLSNYEDIRDNFSWSLFILPFFYSLSFGLFDFLVPARFMTRIIITSLYAIGLYSLFLSHNIFTVASIRTIGLLSSARTVSFVLALVSYFFLSRVIGSFHWSVFISAPLLFIFSFFLSLHCLWTYTLEKVSKAELLWAFVLSFCLLEAFLILWFWPSSPTVVAIFLTGFFYTIIGLSHVWMDKRLFRGVLWEYIWVSVLVFCILILFTSWS